MCVCLISLEWNSGNAAINALTTWYSSISLTTPACSLGRGQTLSTVLSYCAVRALKAECHPGLVLELETVLFLHADL